MPTYKIEYLLAAGRGDETVEAAHYEVAGDFFAFYANVGEDMMGQTIGVEPVVKRVRAGIVAAITTQ